jgi:hypothetical protein
MIAWHYACFPALIVPFSSFATHSWGCGTFWVFFLIQSVASFFLIPTGGTVKKKLRF